MPLDKWVETVSALAMYDPRKLFDKHGNPTEIPELSRLAAMTVAGFEIEELYDGRGEDRQKIGYVRKYKLLDRTPYLQMLGNSWAISGKTRQNLGCLALKTPSQFPWLSFSFGGQKGWTNCPFDEPVLPLRPQFVKS